VDTITVQIALYINGVLYVGMMYYGFTCLFKPVIQKRWIFLLYLAFSVVPSYLFIRFGGEWVILIINTIVFLGIAFLFSGSLGAKLIFAFLLYVLSIVADAIAFVSLSYTYYRQYGVTPPIEYMLPFGRTVSNILFLPLLLLAIMVFRKFFSKQIQSKHFKVPNTYVFAVFSLLLGIILINLRLIMAEMSNIQANATQALVSQFIVLAIIFLVIWLYNTGLHHFETLEKSRMKDQMLERWEIQYKAAVNTQKVIERLTHNLRFHFLTLLDFIEKNDVEKMKQHIEGTLGKFDRVVHTGNISIDSMLNYYMRRIKEVLDIDLETELSIPADLKLDATLIAMALGNALENALDACEHVPSAERYIHLKAMITHSRSLLIIIANPYAVAPIAAEGNILLTTKADKQKHGLGLPYIQEILPEEMGQIHVTYSDGVFQFKLLFYNVLDENV